MAKSCKVLGCAQRRYGRGYCRPHWKEALLRQPPPLPGAILSEASASVALGFLPFKLSGVRRQLMKEGNEEWLSLLPPPNSSGCRRYDAEALSRAGRMLHLWEERRAARQMVSMRLAQEGSRAKARLSPEVLKEHARRRDARRDPQRRKEYRRRKRLLDRGLEEWQYSRRLRQQGGTCAICRQPETQVGTGGETLPLAVDHCHTGGHVRGLLCSRCNLTLGRMGDSTSRLLRAWWYVRKPPFCSPPPSFSPVSKGERLKRGWASRHVSLALSTSQQEARRKAKREERRLRRSYGLDSHKRFDLFRDQNFRCGVCSGGGRLVVDHDHCTGAVRGVLCDACNMSLGGAFRRPEVLLTAIQYLCRSGRPLVLGSSGLPHPDDRDT
jgi:hypothetical protein